MANLNERFSTGIQDITPEEAEWVTAALNLLMDAQDIEEKQERILREDVLSEGADPEDLLDDGDWPGFEWELREDRFLWLYSEENFNVSNLGMFALAFIKKFRPEMVFSVGWACTCSRPRLNEFGGGWMVVSRNGIETGSTFKAIGAAEELARKRLKLVDPVCPSCGGKDILLCSYQSGNINEPIKLTVEEGEVTSFYVESEAGEISEPMFQCSDCHADLSLGMLRAAKAKGHKKPKR